MLLLKMAKAILLAVIEETWMAAIVNVVLLVRLNALVILRNCFGVVASVVG
jgi:hypothetical protein